VKSDEGKLRQVLMNLLGNAVKFTQQGHVVLRVKAHPPGGNGEPPPDASTGREPVGDTRKVWVHFAVEDTGPGIAPDDLDRLFTPFVQAGAGRESQEGTGLGLAISQQYVRLMGGEIRAESEIGRGSVFAFEVPVEVVSVTELEKPPATHRVTGLEPGQPDYRLLIVDDQEVNRKLLAKILKPIGFQVREAANGREALDLWETWEPHLIWMDMRMPLMDGYETTRRIKATTRGMATIIIAVTASALEEDRALILSEGCDDYIRKPFHEQDLFDVLAKHLGVRYVYEAIEPEESAPAVSMDEQVRWVERLRAVDPMWRAELERATTLGDQGEIERLASRIRAQEPELAEGILELAGRFDHDRILDLIKRCE
jgi:CheY-like chemotaxis protein